MKIEKTLDKIHVSDIQNRLLQIFTSIYQNSSGNRLYSAKH